MRNNNKCKYNIWKFSILNTKKMLNKSYAETLLETQLKFALNKFFFTITSRTEAHGDNISTNFILHEEEGMVTHSSILA